MNFGTTKKNDEPSPSGRVMTKRMIAKNPRVVEGAHGSLHAVVICWGERDYTGTALK